MITVIIPGWNLGEWSTIHPSIDFQGLLLWMNKNKRAFIHVSVVVGCCVHSAQPAQVSVDIWRFIETITCNSENLKQRYLHGLVARQILPDLWVSCLSWFSPVHTRLKSEHVHTHKFRRGIARARDIMETYRCLSPVVTRWPYWLSKEWVKLTIWSECVCWCKRTFLFYALLVSVCCRLIV